MIWPTPVFDPVVKLPDGRYSKPILGGVAACEQARAFLTSPVMRYQSIALIREAEYLPRDATARTLAKLLLRLDLSRESVASEERTRIVGGLGVLASGKPGRD